MLGRNRKSKNNKEVFMQSCQKNLLKINNKRKYVNEMSFTEIHKVIENQLTRHIYE